MRWSLVHECLATADFFKFGFLAISVILAIDNRNFSRKMRESIKVEKHSTIDQEGKPLIVRGVLSLLWQIDFSSLRARELITTFFCLLDLT